MDDSPSEIPESEAKTQISGRPRCRDVTGIRGKRERFRQFFIASLMISTSEEEWSDGPDTGSNR